VSSDSRATSGAAEIEHQRDADELRGHLEDHSGVALLIAEGGGTGQGTDLRPGFAQPIDLYPHKIDVAGAQIARCDTVVAHRGLDGAVEIVEIVGAHGCEAGERQGCHAGRVLEPGCEALHIRQHSDFAAEWRLP